MSVSVDFKSAEQILVAAIGAVNNIDDEFTKIIKRNLEGGHKTYKYVLLTGLLAKSTNNAANPLSLQAGSIIEGAYDARSLCHKVFVPFERQYLKNVLGGSNEPFLNKPARFTELSNTNAVRAGKDLKTLNELITLFSAIQNSEVANNYLVYALNLLKNKIKLDEAAGLIKLKEVDELDLIFQFIEVFSEKSFEGESTVIIVGALEKIYNESIDSNCSISIHKVNQSGASSKEVGDIDVYSGKILKYCIEIKDKEFTEYDLQHAFVKMHKSGVLKGFFIAGPRAKWDADSIMKELEALRKNGFFGDLLSFKQYCRSILLRISFDEINFGETLIDVAKEINCKQETMAWLFEVLKKFELIL